MTYRIYAMRDAKVGFMSPILDRSDASAIRSFVAAADGNKVEEQNPTDFSLWFLGTFDSDTGELNPIEPSNVAELSAHIFNSKGVAFRG